MNTRMTHRNHARTRANTVRYGRAYEMKETAFEALVHHGTNVVHRKSIESHGSDTIGPESRALWCTLDREDAIRWAWASIRRDRNLVSDPCGEELWPMPMLATFALVTNRTLLVRGWDWDLPKALARHLDVPLPECDGVDEAVAMLTGPMRAGGIDALACLSPGRPGSNEVVVYRTTGLTLLGCRTLTELRRH